MIHHAVFRDLIIAALALTTAAEARRERCPDFAGEGGFAAGALGFTGMTRLLNAVSKNCAV